jgi:acylphosphatase
VSPEPSSDQTTRSVKLRITGRVQGVGYRAWAIEAAERAGLRGWVRNRADGTVEALLTGDDDAVAWMIEACRDGPFAARVSGVAVGDAEDDGCAGFRPKPTV